MCVKGKTLVPQWRQKIPQMRCVSRYPRDREREGEMRRNLFLAPYYSHRATRLWDPEGSRSPFPPSSLPSFHSISLSPHGPVIRNANPLRSPHPATLSFLLSLPRFECCQKRLGSAAFVILQCECDVNGAIRRYEPPPHPIPARAAFFAYAACPLCPRWSWF